MLTLVIQRHLELHGLGHGVGQHLIAITLLAASLVIQLFHQALLGSVQLLRRNRLSGHALQFGEQLLAGLSVVRVTRVQHDLVLATAGVKQ
ncbi:hypothetical protein D3C77_425850 [compost metagenome]